MTQVVHAYGQSGRIYEFRLYDVGNELPATAAVYVFATPSGNGRQWKIIDFGQLPDVRERFCNPGAILRIRASGTTRIGLYTQGLEDTSLRRVIEHDLLAMYAPQLLEGITWKGA